MSDDLQTAFDSWKKAPEPVALNSLLQAANPVLDRAVTSYAGRQNPILKARAKSLAIQAFKTYDPKRGAKLKTHLMFQLQPLRRSAVRSGQIIHQPEQMAYDKRALDRVQSEYLNANDREPTDSELADITGLSQRRIQAVRRTVRPSMATGQAGQEFEVPVSAPKAEDMWLEYVYHELSSIDKKILDWRLGRHGYQRVPNQEIARKLRMSSAAVSQRMSRIAERLQEGEGLKA